MDIEILGLGLVIISFWGIGMSLMPPQKKYEKVAAVFMRIIGIILTFPALMRILE